MAELTSKFSALRNKLGGEGVKDEGIMVSCGEGADEKVIGNVLVRDSNSDAYGRTL